jgi:hypothetical protein
MSAGAQSAEGEALQRFPPMVALLRNGNEPITEIASDNAGNCSPTLGDVSIDRSGAAAPKWNPIPDFDDHSASSGNSFIFTNAS